MLGIADADSAENEPGARHIVSTPVGCPLPGSRAGVKLGGSAAVQPVPGSLLAELCGEQPLIGAYTHRRVQCNFETNPEYLPRWLDTGLQVAARDAGGELRAFSLAGSCFFLATLFQPQLSSRPREPHPIVSGFLRACAG